MIVNYENEDKTGEREENNNIYNYQYQTIINSLLKIDERTLNLININKIIDSYYAAFTSKSDKENLLFNLEGLNSINTTEIKAKLEQEKFNFSNDMFILYSIKLFFYSKYISQTIQIDRTKELEIINDIETEISNYDHLVLWAYLYKLSDSSSNIGHEYKLHKFKKDMTYEGPTMLQRKFSSIIEDEKYLINFFLNQLSFIHFNEFLVMIIKNPIYRYDVKMISTLHINLLIVFFVWKRAYEVIIFY
jgi:hypothetical protein